MLRQRDGRVVQRDHYVRADPPAHLARARRGQESGVRIHRDLVQPPVPAHAQIGNLSPHEFEPDFQVKLDEGMGEAAKFHWLRKWAASSRQPSYVRSHTVDLKLAKAPGGQRKIVLKGTSPPPHSLLKAKESAHHLLVSFRISRYIRRSDALFRRTSSA